MAIQYAEFLSASNILREVMKEIKHNTPSEELSKKSLNNRILKKCYKLTLERYSDFKKQELIKDYITNILLPIYRINYIGIIKKTHESYYQNTFVKC
ncbi:MAG: hypothetical protein A2V66_11780 [Ignavibacteria bacterium RBG_13_36_8]|nr:MAG: hypothetical protein A2V66_11780 [Ignavibacteria bacterium RBG_13_36_8]